MGYNVQTAVDTKHHLIVAHEVTNIGHDRVQQTSIAVLARQATGKSRLTAIADRGYFSGQEIRMCEQQGCVPLVPELLTSGNRAQGLFNKHDFIYIAKRDEYLCPAGRRAPWRCSSEEKGMTIHKYWSSK